MRAPRSACAWLCNCAFLSANLRPAFNEFSPVSLCPLASPSVSAASRTPYDILVGLMLAERQRDAGNIGQVWQSGATTISIIIGHQHPHPAYIDCVYVRLINRQQRSATVDVSSSSLRPNHR